MSTLYRYFGAHEMVAMMECRDFHDGFRINSIFLVSLDERLHVARRYQLYLMA